MFNCRAPRFVSAALSVVICASLLLCSGCGKSGRAASVQTPPPPTLSEPVRPMETAPATSPSIPASNSEDYAAQRAGETRELPAAVTVPLPASKPLPAAVAAPAPKSGDARYHTLAKGETVYAISRMYGVKAKDIIQANNFRDPNRLSVGTKVYIP